MTDVSRTKLNRYYRDVSDGLSKEFGKEIGLITGDGLNDRTATLNLPGCFNFRHFLGQPFWPV